MTKTRLFFRLLAGALAVLGGVVIGTSYFWLVMTSPKFIALLETDRAFWYIDAGLGLLAIAIVCARALLYHPDAVIPRENIEEGHTL